jgi:hypothetical protein
LRCATRKHWCTHLLRYLVSSVVVNLQSKLHCSAMVGTISHIALSKPH